MEHKKAREAPIQLQTENYLEAQLANLLAQFAITHDSRKSGKLIIFPRERN